MQLKLSIWLLASSLMLTFMLWDGINGTTDFVYGFERLN